MGRVQEKALFKGGIVVEELIEQYHNASNLEARIKLHELYSLNKKDWFTWLFEQYQIDSGSKLLELGCGDGTFWAKNEQLIPNDWNVVLSDFSPGMLADAQRKLTNLPAIQFEQINIESIPYPDNSFDIVAANFMLYHVENRKKGLQEIRRVLKPGGKLYAATIGEQHLMEFGTLLSEFDPSLDFSSAANNAKAFGLESGTAQLKPYFSKVELKLFADGLKIPDVEPVIAYLLSTHTNLKDQLTVRKLTEFRLFLEEKKKKDGGFIRITKASGLFEAQ